MNLPLVLHLLVRIDPSSSDLTVTEKSAFAGFRYYNDWTPGTPRNRVRGRRPLATASATRPVGQMAWILEKFWAWT